MPLIYTNCPLYGLQSKKQLCYLLRIQNKDLLKQEYVSSLIEPCIINEGKPRLIEPPKEELKSIQTTIKKHLGKIEIPTNVFSGIKGRSYIDNAFYHIGDRLRYLYKIDLTAFFPSISRNTVYSFFHNDLECSPDIANILCNFTTIDLEKTKMKDPDTVYAFLNGKHIKCFNHLISGAPTSQILSYLVNSHMFNELQFLADKNDIKMSVYVDDITFSSTHRISNRIREHIIHIINKYHYRISKRKVKYYTKKYPKLITGVIISADGKPTVKNSLRLKIIKEHDTLRECTDETQSKNRLRGLLIAARRVESDAYPTIHSYAFNKK